MYIRHLPFAVAIDSRELCPLRTLHEICMTLRPPPATGISLVILKRSFWLYNYAALKMFVKHVVSLSPENEVINVIYYTGWFTRRKAGINHCKSRSKLEMKTKLGNTVYQETLSRCLLARFATFPSVCDSACCPPLLAATFANLSDVWDFVSRRVETNFSIFFNPIICTSTKIHTLQVSISWVT
jgi:hypothetical protein